MSEQITIILIIIYIAMVFVSRLLSKLALSDMSFDERIQLKNCTSDISKYSISLLIIISVIMFYFFKNYGFRLEKALSVYAAVLIICSAAYYFGLMKSIVQLKDIVRKPFLFAASKTILFASLGYLFAVLFAFLSSRIDVITYVTRN